MSNADRKLDIIEAITDIGPVTFGGLAKYLGGPYYLDANIADLIAEGMLVEQVQHGRSGTITRIALA